MEMNNMFLTVNYLIKDRSGSGVAGVYGNEDIVILVDKVQMWRVVELDKYFVNRVLLNLFHFKQGGCGEEGCKYAGVCGQSKNER